MGDLDVFGVALAAALVYLLVLRVLDANEREPLWSLALFLHLGIAASLVTRLLVGSAVLELTIFPSAVSRESATLVALLAGTAVLGAVARWRGWSEMTDVVDGLVYGAATGLGVALGDIVARELARPETLVAPRASLGALAAASALAGLASGVFGAIVGLGIGLGVDRRGWRRAALVACAFVAAVAAHAGYDWWARGDTLSGPASFARAWAALAAPLLLVAGAGAYGLLFERHAIDRELDEEVTAGLVTPEERRLLLSVTRRRVRYLAAWLAHGPRQALRVAALHNRQVQLAVAKRRLERVDDPRRRPALGAEIEAIRRSIAVVRQELSR